MLKLLNNMENKIKELLVLKAIENLKEDLTNESDFYINFFLNNFDDFFEIDDNGTININLSFIYTSSAKELARYRQEENNK